MLDESPEIKEDGIVIANFTYYTPISQPPYYAANDKITRGKVILYGQLHTKPGKFVVSGTDSGIFVAIIWGYCPETCDQAMVIVGLLFLLFIFVNGDTILTPLILLQVATEDCKEFILANRLFITKLGYYTIRLTSWKLQNLHIPR